MQGFRYAGLTAGLVLLSSCAVFDPFIGYRQEVDPDDTKRCATQAVGDPAVEFACDMAIKMERARSDIVRTRAGLTTTLFPIAGIIGYNAARDMNAATNAALVAGGIAAYSTVTTLAQPDRVKVYEEGIRSIQCGVSVYQSALVLSPPSLSASLFNARLQQGHRHLAEVKEEVSKKVKKADTGYTEQSVDAYRRLLENLDAIKDQANPGSLLQNQLIALVRQTTSSVNRELNNTIATSNELLAIPLGNFKPPHSRGGAIVEALVGEQPPWLQSEASTLLSLLDNARTENAENASTADFGPCKYAGPSDVGTKLPVTQLMLGPGNALDGKSVDRMQGESFSTPVMGGQPPYRADMVNKPDGSNPVYGLGGTSTAPTLVLNVPADMVVGEYVLMVTDSGGWQSRSVTVNVKAKGGETVKRPPASK